MSILVVDDDDLNRTMLRRGLEGCGHSVTVARDGLGALSALESTDVDGIISDAVMPRMDGFRLCLALRRHERWRKIPFVLLTGRHEDAEDRRLADQVGVDAFLLKPAPVSALLEALQISAEGERTERPYDSLPDSGTVLEQFSTTLVARLEEKNAELSRSVHGLAASESRFQAALDAMMEGCLILNHDLRITYANGVAIRQWGCDREALLGKLLTEAVPGIAGSNLVDAMQSALRRREPQRIESELVHDDGPSAWFEYSLRPMSEGLFVLALDITNRKQAERATALQHSATRLLCQASSLLQAGKEWLQLVGEHQGWRRTELWLTGRGEARLRCIASWNADAGAIGLPETLPMESFLPDEGLAGKAWTDGQVRWSGDLKNNPDFHRAATMGSAGLDSVLVVPVRIRNEPIAVVMAFSDSVKRPDPAMLDLLSELGVQFGQFVERHRLEEQFHQAQKMEAIGTLAGGIAHDFNNILSAVVGFSELAAFECEDRPAALKYLRSAGEGADRAVALVRQILAFSRPHAQEQRPMSVWPIVEEAVRLLRAAIPASIEIKARLVRSVEPIMGDATQIHQLLLNLATNAAHAMKANGGTLAIELSAEDLDAASAASLVGLSAGAHVVLTVEDTGCGMDPATLRRIFEPFFTTKPPGEGTGLGLAMVHGVVQAHRGAVTVQSAPNQGTKFRVWFPAIPAPAATAAVHSEIVPRGAGERVLVVDDESVLADLAADILSRLGYFVDQATSGLAGLVRLSDAPNHFDLVVTDLTMPGLSGTDLVRRLRDRHIDVPVILTTGFNPDLGSQPRELGITSVLLKPFSSATLGRAVAGALRQRV